jgi:hypothetical protein
MSTPNSNAFDIPVDVFSTDGGTILNIEYLVDGATALIQLRDYKVEFNSEKYMSIHGYQRRNFSGDYNLFFDYFSTKKIKGS